MISTFLRQILIISSASTLILCTVVGNALVILTICVHRQFHSAGYYYILNLAFADLLVGLISMPTKLLLELQNDSSQWPYNLFLCDLYMAFDFCVTSASLLTLCIMSLDRYRAINRPYKHLKGKSGKKTILLIQLCWFMPLMTWVLFLFLHRFINLNDFHGYFHKTSIALCSYPVPLYTTTILIMLNYYVPVIFMVVCYGRLMRHIHQLNIQKKNEKMWKSIQFLINLFRIGQPKSMKSIVDDFRHFDDGNTSNIETVYDIRNSSDTKQPCCESRKKNLNNVKEHPPESNRSSFHKKYFYKSPSFRSVKSCIIHRSCSNRENTKLLQDKRRLSMFDSHPNRIKRINIEMFNKKNWKHEKNSDNQKKILKLFEKKSSDLSFNTTNQILSLSPRLKQHNQNRTHRITSFISVPSTSFCSNQQQQQQQPISNFNKNVNNLNNGNGLKRLRHASCISLDMRKISFFGGKKSLRQKSNISTSSEFLRNYTKKVQMKRNKKAVAMLGILMVSFLICWLPWIILWPIDLCFPNRVPYIAMNLGWWLGYFNSFTNPLLYVYVNKKFRENLLANMKILKKRCRSF
ncbi:hypothetical protein SNEBB_002997 [Seison nebaliae]|nr:hypothetical protein SNEBB_002997 [Seison nebaliae]